MFFKAQNIQAKNIYKYIWFIVPFVFTKLSTHVFKQRDQRFLLVVLICNGHNNLRIPG